MTPVYLTYNKDLKAGQHLYSQQPTKILSENGVGGNMLNFIENFVSSRRFRVGIGQTFSSWRQQENGIPQGSVLSVTLFLVSVNEITRNASGSVQMVGYADDWYLVKRGNLMSNIQRELQITIDRLSKWADKTGFTFSAAKTKAIHICRSRKTKRPHLDPKLTMNGHWT